MDHHHRLSDERKSRQPHRYYLIFAAFVEKTRQRGIHLVPIVDAGVKVEEGYDVYEEGVANDYFCHNKDGGIFRGTVWPGVVHFPDFFRPEVRRWFGDKYTLVLYCP